MTLCPSERKMGIWSVYVSSKLARSSNNKQKMNDEQIVFDKHVMVRTLNSFTVLFSISLIIYWRRCWKSGWWDTGRFLAAERQWESKREFETGFAQFPRIEEKNCKQESFIDLQQWIMQVNITWASKRVLNFKNIHFEMIWNEFFSSINSFHDIKTV